MGATRPLAQVLSGLPHEFPESDEIRYAVQLWRAILPSAFPQAKYEAPGASLPSTWMGATQSEMAQFLIQYQSGTRFLMLQHAIPCGRALFATLSVRMVLCGSPASGALLFVEILTSARFVLSGQFAL
jgi:hypothetical protein